MLRVLQRKETKRINRLTCYKELVHIIMEADSKLEMEERDSGVILIRIQRPENEEHQWSTFQSERRQAQDPRRAILSV